MTILRDIRAAELAQQSHRNVQKTIEQVNAEAAEKIEAERQKLNVERDGKVVLDCPYAAGQLADVLCEFCEMPLCQKCVRQNTFGSCCISCNRDVETGVIDEHGFREACLADAEEMDRFGIPYPTPPEIFKCGGQIIDSRLDE